MLIQVNFGDVQHSDALEEATKDAVNKALEHVSSHVTRVEVHLRDDNSPNKAGRVDKRCTMEARLAGRQPKVIEHTGNDLYVLVRESAGKLERLVKHEVGKHHQKH